MYYDSINNNYKEDIMKKIICSIILVFIVIIHSHSIGLTLGPFSNEQYLIENDNQFHLNYYDFPTFYGGVYHKINFSDKLFYYVDLAFDIHNSRLDYQLTENDMNNYFFYFHNDINLYPLDQTWVYIGAGMELIVIDRIFKEATAHKIGYNFFVSTNYFCYIDGGINIPIGIMEIGFKILYRVLPFSINNRMGNGELTILIGLK
jgi:hypothetical protein